MAHTGLELSMWLRTTELFEPSMAYGNAGHGELQMLTGWFVWGLPLSHLLPLLLTAGINRNPFESKLV